MAVEKGFITKVQFFEAIEVQIESDLKGDQPELIGSILRELGHMTTRQIDEVVESMSKKQYTCPNCGVMILECPNCGAILR